MYGVEFRLSVPGPTKNEPSVYMLCYRTVTDDLKTFKWKENNEKFTHNERSSSNAMYMYEYVDFHRFLERSFPQLWEIAGGEILYDS